MNELNLTGADVIIVAILVLWLGNTITKRVSFLLKYSIPIAVTGGLICSVAVLLVGQFGGPKISFDMEIRDALLLVFFSTIGLSAKFSRLASGGKALGILVCCAAVFLVLQNVTGVLLAKLFGQHPGIGLFAGSISLAGGHGTAIAWGQEAAAAGFAEAELVGIAFATFGLVAGGIIGGPVAEALIKKNNLTPTDTDDAGGTASDAATAEGESVTTAKSSLQRALSALLVLAVCAALGRVVNEFLFARDFKVPGFLTAMLVGMTTEGSKDYVPPPERIATFDNDGCLWSEQPAYFQLFFAIDRVKASAADHPEWKEKQPFKAVLEDDRNALLEAGEEGLIQLVMASHAGMTAEEFAEAVRDWSAKARHPRFDRPYTELVFQPMLELLEYLRANEFKTFIVSGGGIDFLRVFAEEIYDIPPEQVVGSSIKSKYEVRDGKPVIVKEPELSFIDDKEGKPVGIHQHIGRRPIFAAGNSDGDFQMLEWTTAGDGPRFGLLVHHTDAEREWAYDRESHVGKLDRGLDEGPKRGWHIIDMKRDWKAIYPMPK